MSLANAGINHWDESVVVAMMWSLTLPLTLDVLDTNIW